MQTMNAADSTNPGFETLLPVFAQFVCRELQKKNKENWWQEFVHGKLGEA
jgi:hypothetical protein